MKKQADKKTRLVLCISCEEYPVSLEANKLYRMLPDEGDEELGMIRVIDESGEDHLYPEEMFAILPEDALTALRLSGETRRRVLESLGSA